MRTNKTNKINSGRSIDSIHRFCSFLSSANIFYTVLSLLSVLAITKTVMAKGRNDRSTAADSEGLIIGNATERSSSDTSTDPIQRVETEAANLDKTNIDYGNEKVFRLESDYTDEVCIVMSAEKLHFRKI